MPQPHVRGRGDRRAGREAFSGRGGVSVERHSLAEGGALSRACPFPGAAVCDKGVRIYLLGVAY